MQWIKDKNGNKCSVEYFGSIKKAQAALDSLVDCKNCVNCSDCSYCSPCSRCSRCSDCSYCSYCSGLKNEEKAESVKIPKIKNIHQKVFEAASQPNALDMNAWHACETTHCRAGWVVHLAGEEGRKLEKFHNTPLAAALIYRESSPFKVSMARFYEKNDEAMEDMRRMAELEKEGEE